MFMVYWFDGESRFKHFDSDKMSDALQLMNELRQRPDASFITMASENPNNVGKMGVAAAPADYSWTKRRNNERDPAVEVSRRKLYNSNDEVEVPLDGE